MRHRQWSEKDKSTINEQNNLIEINNVRGKFIDEMVGSGNVAVLRKLSR